MDPSFDLSDEWVERDRPPTIQLDNHRNNNNNNMTLPEGTDAKLNSMSRSGSLNVLSDKSAPRLNVERFAANDLFKRGRTQLENLFERGATRQPDTLSVVDEHPSQAETEIQPPVPADSRPTTAQAIRGADGMVANFSFPARLQESAGEAVVGIKHSKSEMIISSHLTSNDNAPDVPSPAAMPRSKSEWNIPTTPQRSPEKSAVLSPSKSPLKLFQNDYDTFTQDRMSRVLGMLGGGGGDSFNNSPVVENIGKTVLPEANITSIKDNGDTQKTNESEKTNESGPQRKRAKTHEPVGSITTQNFMNNADNVMARMRLKGGLLGKGLPRIGETSILGSSSAGVTPGIRRTSSGSHGERRRSVRIRDPLSTAPQISGFEPVPEETSAAKESARPTSGGLASVRSHFSDWTSEGGGGESRKVSSMTDPVLTEPLGASTVVGGAADAKTKPAGIPAQRLYSPRYNNIPPHQNATTMRMGDMVYSRRRQEWLHADEYDEDDERAEADDEPRPQSGYSSPRKQTQHLRQPSADPRDYPDELDLSDSFGHEKDQETKKLESSFIKPAEPTKIDASYRSNVSTGSRRLTVQELSFHDERQEAIDAAAEQDMLSAIDEDESAGIHQTIAKQIAHSPPRRTAADLIKVSEMMDRDTHRGVSGGELTCDMTFSESQRELAKAVGLQYEVGLWETVTHLDLRKCKLGSVRGLAEMCPHLIDLDISDNQLVHLDGLPSTLRVLCAAGNELDEVTSFAHLTNLQVLDVERNSLRDLSEFGRLPHLRQLSVRNNQLERLDGLDNLSNLQYLDASENQLTSADFRFLELYSLETLDLARNALTSVQGIESLIRLVKLDLSHNHLPEIHVEQPVAHLRVLKLASNQLEQYDVGMFPKVRVLYLDDNRLRGFGAGAASVSPNDTTAIARTTITTLKHLEKLSLRRNPLVWSEVDQTLVRECESLYIGGCAVGDLVLREQFLSLKYLEIAGCGLRQLPSDLALYLPNLRVLNAAHNSLSSTTVAAAISSGFSRLERLLLQHNRLKDLLPLQSALIHTRLRVLDLRNNPVTAGIVPPTTTTTTHIPQDRPRQHQRDYYAVFDGGHWRGESGGGLSTAATAGDEEEESEMFKGLMSPRAKARREAYTACLVGSLPRLTMLDGERVGVEVDEDEGRAVKERAKAMAAKADRLAQSLVETAQI
ncbi:Protein nud1 [Savitreella phatthalungensis]